MPAEGVVRPIDVGRIAAILARLRIGTLSAGFVAGMRAAITGARARPIPWALDPVGVGATRWRSEVAADLVALQPAVIRANASETIALAGLARGATRGVDSTAAAGDAHAAAAALARRSRAVVAVTGVVDHVTDGTRVVAIANGDARMARVTGLGCTATALVGAALAVEPDPLVAAVAGLAWLGVAGEIAAAASEGPGSLQVKLLDGLAALDEAALAARLRLS
jgi:hydroxyethylthiazole kinase